jgi:hypothetical protein
MLNLGIAKGEIPGAVLLIARQGKVAYFTPHEAGPPVVDLRGCPSRLGWIN